MGVSYKRAQLKVILSDRFTSIHGIEKEDVITLQIGGAPVRLKVVESAAYDMIFLRHTKGAAFLIPLPALAGFQAKQRGTFIAFFSLTMSLFIIYSSCKIITLECLPVIGTFRSMGAANALLPCWTA